MTPAEAVAVTMDMALEASVVTPETALDATEVMSAREKVNGAETGIWYAMKR